MRPFFAVLLLAGWVCAQQASYRLRDELFEAEVLWLKGTPEDRTDGGDGGYFAVYYLGLLRYLDPAGDSQWVLQDEDLPTIRLLEGDTVVGAGVDTLLALTPE